MKSSLAGSGDIIKYRTLLLMQSGNNSQQTLGKVTACATLGPKAPLTPEHDGAEGPLGGVIGKLYTFLVDKSPQRRLVLKQGAAPSDSPPTCNWLASIMN